MKQLITDLEKIVSLDDEPARIKQVADRLREYLRGQPVLDPKFTRPRKDTYARHLIHRDVSGRFVVIAMVWGPGQGTPVHDHGTWGVVGMLENKIAAWVYDRQDDGTRDGYAKLRKVGAVEADQGSILPTVLPG